MWRAWRHSTLSCMLHNVLRTIDAESRPIVATVEGCCSVSTALIKRSTSPIPVHVCKGDVGTWKSEWSCMVTVYSILPVPIPCSTYFVGPPTVPLTAPQPRLKQSIEVGLVMAGSHSCPDCSRQKTPTEKDPGIDRRRVPKPRRKCQPATVGPQAKSRDLAWEDRFDPQQQQQQHDEKPCKSVARYNMRLYANYVHIAIVVSVSISNSTCFIIHLSSTVR